MKTIKHIFCITIILSSTGICFAQWLPDVRLTNDPANSYTSSARCIAAKGDSIHVVWQEYRDGAEPEIYYKRSVNRGTTWSSDTRLTNNSGFSGQPSITLNQSVIHIVWEDNRDGNSEIYYMRSTNAGSTWEPAFRLTNNAGSSNEPDINVAGQVIYVMWNDDRDGNYEIYFKRSTNSGLNWSSDTRLTNNSAQSNYVSVSSSGVNVHCVWQDYRDTTTEVYYKRSTDAGNTWSADARLTNNPAASNGPTISVTGQNAHVFWSDTRIGNAELYYKRSTDGGASWSSDTRLTFAADEANNPGSFAFGPFVAITWSGWRTGFYEIYYKSSIDGGLNWSNDLQLTPSSNSGGSYKPSIDVSDSAAHVVWYDNRDGNNEVYYKKNIFSFPVGITNTNPETPTEFSLSQNFPNPFNPVTNIGFRIADFGFVSLKVYDVMGKEVAALINEDLSIGIYNVSFDASGLASGIYLYKLESNDFSQTRKMVLIK